MTVSKLVEGLSFKEECFKIFLRKLYCINITKINNQVLRTFVFPGVHINFQVAL